MIPKEISIGSTKSGASSLEGNLRTLANFLSTETLVDQHKVVIHKGGKESPIIATANLQGARKGSVVIDFTEPQARVQLEHVYHKIPAHTQIRISLLKVQNITGKHMQH